MSARYEWDTADAVLLDAVGPGTQLGGDEVEPGHHALVIGDPWASAYMVEGTAGQLHEFLRRAGELLPPAALARRRILPRPVRRKTP